jgi:hypothetical protein
MAALLLLGGPAPAGAQTNPEQAKAEQPPPGGGGTPPDDKGPPGLEIVVQPGVDTLKEAVANAHPQAVLVLEPGIYLATSTVLIDKDLTIRGATQFREDVHIVAVDKEEFNFEELKFDPLDRGHIIFVTDGARKVKFRHFTIKNAPETDIDAFTCEEEPPFGFGLNHTECFGDAIHVDGATEVEVEQVEASLNAGNGFYINGVDRATFRHILGVNNGAFGIDVDTAHRLEIRQSVFIANQVSGVEASGHPPGLTRAEYTADVEMRRVLAKGNGEIGLEVERFETATLKAVTCADNREDGFDADRVSVVKISDSAFINNVDDGIELFPAGDGVPPDEQPVDFPGSIIEDFQDLEFSGNVDQDIERPPTED